MAIKQLRNGNSKVGIDSKSGYIYVESESVPAAYTDRKDAYGVQIGDTTVLSSYSVYDYFKSTSLNTSTSEKTQILRKMNEAQYYFSENAVNYFK